MDRRTFLKSAGRRQAGRGKQQQLLAGLAPYNGPWTESEVSHLLRRCLFGASQPETAYFLSLNPAAAVDELINNTHTAAPPVRDYGLLEDEGVLYDDLGVAIGQTWVNDPNTASDPVIRSQINGRRVQSLKKWWAGLILNRQRSIQEKMVLFWHHHFSIQESEVNDAAMLYRHHRLLRDNALGNFKTLVREVTIDPAMLLHLNGYLNSKQAPDENYARELQELFTVGKGNDSLYTEDDVIAAARVLTGWRISDNPLGVYADTGAHDTGNKTFSSFYNNSTISGSTDLYQELDALIDMIFSTTEAARFICRKLYKWFVYYEISEATETEVILPMADRLMQDNFDIRPALALLLKSEHFFALSNQACYIKTPLDFIAGTLREFNVPIPHYTDYVNGYPFFGNIYQQAARMQQQLFQPPDVSGWPSYYQEPMFYELWVNSNSLPRRADYTNALVNDGVLDLRAYVLQTSNPADPDQLVSEVCERLLRYPLSDTSRTYVKTRFLTNNTAENSVWSNAWNSQNNSYIDNALRDLFRFLMNLPEFHLC